MFVELVGMVGVGKSTLAPIIKTFLQDKDYQVLSLNEAILSCLGRSLVGRIVRGITPSSWYRPLLSKIYYHGIGKLYQVSFALENPLLVWNAYRSQFHLEIPWSHRRIILRLFFELAGGYQFLCHRLRDDEVVILEEGLIHRAINLYAWQTKRLEPNLLMRYFQLLPVLDLVVFVRAPFDVCLARAKERGLPLRLGNKNKQTIDRFMDNSVQIIDVVSKYLAVAERRTLEVDNSKKLADSISALHKGMNDSYVFRKTDDGRSWQPTTCSTN